MMAATDEKQVGRNDNTAHNLSETAEETKIDNSDKQEQAEGNEDDEDGIPHAEEVIVEEDWSSSFQSSTLDSIKSGFAQHEEHRIKIDDNHDHLHHTYLLFYCTPSLSPLDMMNLYHGYHDATGHKVWMGAYVFLEGMIRTTPRRPDASVDIANQCSTDGTIGAKLSHPRKEQREQMTDILTDESVRENYLSSSSSYFSNKRVLELGCGTGVAGLALYFKEELENRWRQQQQQQQQDEENMIPPQQQEQQTYSQQLPPSFITLTDSDSEAIELCRRNFHKNSVLLETAQNNQQQSSLCSSSCSPGKVPTNNISAGSSTSWSIPLAIGKLSWGSSLQEAELNQIVDRVDVNDDVRPNGRGIEEYSSTSPSFIDLYDTVMATDVLYDIGSLKPLLHTANVCLTPKGYFILSHVPRASLPADEYPEHASSGVVASADQLEDCIIKEATNEYEFVHRTTIRPYNQDLSSLVHNDTLNPHAVSFEEMKDAGAAILIFQKT